MWFRRVWTSSGCLGGTRNKKRASALGWQGDRKKSAALARAHAAPKAYLAAVTGNDFFRKEKPEVGTSIFLRRKKWLENLVAELFRYPMTVASN